MTILVYSIAPGFFLLRWIPKRLGIIALNSSLCNGKLRMFGSSDSVKSFSEEFKQSDKMAFLLVRVGSRCRRWRGLFGPLSLDIIRHKSLNS